MGKLRLEASWCASKRKSSRVLIELDLLAVILFVKVAAAALAL